MTLKAFAQERCLRRKRGIKHLETKKIRKTTMRVDYTKKKNRIVYEMSRVKKKKKLVQK